MSPVQMADLLDDAQARIAQAPAGERTITTHHEMLKLAHAGLGLHDLDHKTLALRLGVTDTMAKTEWPKMVKIAPVIAREGWKP